MTLDEALTQFHDTPTEQLCVELLNIAGTALTNNETDLFTVRGVVRIVNAYLNPNDM